MNTSDERSNVRAFVAAYLECALWAETAHGVPEDSGDGTWDTSFESYGLTLDDISASAKRKAMRDCISFVVENQRRLYRLVDSRKASWQQLGHDFWLNRNRHGAGFWDRGYGSTGNKLSEASHVYGSVDLYVSDNGSIEGF